MKCLACFGGHLISLVMSVYRPTVIPRVKEECTPVYCAPTCDTYNMRTQLKLAAVAVNSRKDYYNIYPSIQKPL